MLTKSLCDGIWLDTAGIGLDPAHDLGSHWRDVPVLRVAADACQAPDQESETS
jgi:hypothetical protein